MYVRPRRLTPLQTRALGAASCVVGLFLTYAVVSTIRSTGQYQFRASLLAPVCLLVGPWLLITGTAGAPALPQSPLWHRVTAALLAIIGFAWGLLGFGPMLASWLG